MSEFIELTDINDGKKIYINLNTVIRIRVIQGKTELITNGIGSNVNCTNGVYYTQNFALTYYVQETPKQIMELHQKNL